MRKILSLFSLLLLCIGGAWAQTTVYVAKTAAGFTQGTATATLPSAFGSFNGQVFTTNDASGLAGITVTASSGLSIGEQYINVNNYGDCFKFVTAAPATDYTVTLSAPDGYVIMGYSLGCSANTTNAKHTLTSEDKSVSIVADAPNQQGNMPKSFTVSGLKNQRTSFTINTANNGNTLYVPTFTVIVGTPDEAELAIKQSTAYNIANSWISTIQSANGLVTDASKYISNAKESSEGSYAALLDGDYTTYFHSAWNNGPAEDHYLQAELTEDVSDVYFYFKKRSQNNNNRPTSITISGSNDGTNFTEITTINSGLPTGASPIDYLSSKINLGGTYKHLRFTVTATSTGAANNGHVFFTFSEFYILPSTTEIDEVLTIYHSLPSQAADLTTAEIDAINAANTALLSTTVNVTYELYESDGTTLINSEVVVQNKNSEVNAPTSFTSNAYYDYAIDGTIGTSDCTIKITRTLKAGIVYPISNLSNSKSYYIKTRNNARGALSTYTDANDGVTYLASPVKSALGATAKKFAILSYEGNYYLYSVDDQKFVTYSASQKAPLADVITGTTDRIAFSATTTPLYEMRFDGSASKIINSSADYAYGMVFNAWGQASNQWDDGCQYTIEEADNFDATDALAALEEFFHPTNYWNRVEAEVVPFLETTKIGKPFGISMDAATQIAMNYNTQLNSMTFTQEEYEGIVALKNAGLLYPEEGKYYCIKSVSNGKYINVKTANGIYANATTPTAASVVKAVVRNGHMYFATQEKEFGWCYDSSSKALLDAANGGKYVHWGNITTPGQIAFAHCIGNGEGSYAGYLSGSYYTVGENDQVCGGAATAAAAQWTFEEVTSVEVALHDGGDGHAYATFLAPFDATFTNAKAYTVTKGDAVAGVGSEAVLTEVSVVPAGTPVVVISDDATLTAATATIGSGAEAIDPTTNILSGTCLEKELGTDDLVFGKTADNVGFFKYADGANRILGTNRAYIEAEQAAGIRAFVFVDPTTGISSSLFNTEKGTAYDLQGRRVNNTSKGLYILNGKKVLVK